MNSFYDLKGPFLAKMQTKVIRKALFKVKKFNLHAVQCTMLKQLNSDKLLVALAPKNLLKHSVYIKWNKGELKPETLRHYAKEYYHHVRNFPQCLSSLHSLAPSMADRQILLENLVEEEQGDKNHPQLWMNFAKGLGLSDKQVFLRYVSYAMHETDESSCHGVCPFTFTFVWIDLDIERLMKRSSVWQRPIW